MLSFNAFLPPFFACLSGAVSALSSAPTPLSLVFVQFIQISEISSCLLHMCVPSLTDSWSEATQLLLAGFASFC